MNFHAIGIDVSHWQGTPDFKKVKAAGRNFVIVKLTNGVTVDAQAATRRRRGNRRRFSLKP